MSGQVSDWKNYVGTLMYFGPDHLLQIIEKKAQNDFFLEKTQSFSIFYFW